MSYDPKCDPLVDECLIPYLETLNSIDGIETVQSCSGHKEGEKRSVSSDIYACDGHIWFKAAQHRFTDEDCVNIATWDGVISISRMWGREFFPVVEVIFEKHDLHVLTRICELYGSDPAG